MIPYLNRIIPHFECEPHKDNNIQWKHLKFGRSKGKEKRNATSSSSWSQRLPVDYEWQ